VTEVDKQILRRFIQLSGGNMSDDEINQVLLVVVEAILDHWEI
jgi:hypothetical protein